MLTVCVLCFKSKKCLHMASTWWTSQSHVSIMCCVGIITDFWWVGRMLQSILTELGMAVKLGFNSPSGHGNEASSPNRPLKCPTLHLLRSDKKQRNGRKHHFKECFDREKTICSAMFSCLPLHQWRSSYLRKPLASVDMTFSAPWEML